MTQTIEITKRTDIRKHWNLLPLSRHIAVKFEGTAHLNTGVSNKGLGEVLVVTGACVEEGCVGVEGLVDALEGCMDADVERSDDAVKGCVDADADVEGLDDVVEGCAAVDVVYDADGDADTELEVVVDILACVEPPI